MQLVGRCSWLLVVTEGLDLNKSEYNMWYVCTEHFFSCHDNIEKVVS